MIWDRKVEVVQGPLGPLSREPEPASDIFETMLDLLVDAEKWDNRQQFTVALAILDELKIVIEDYRDRNSN